MEIDDMLKERNNLITEIGKDVYNSMVDDISEIVHKNHLDKTPTILEDLLCHIVKLIQIRNI